MLLNKISIARVVSVDSFFYFRQVNSVYLNVLQASGLNIAAWCNSRSYKFKVAWTLSVQIRQLLSLDFSGESAFRKDLFLLKNMGQEHLQEP